MDAAEYVQGMNQESRIIQLISSVDKVPGILTLEEGYTLFKLAQTWPIEGDTVEIGSLNGRSTCFLGLGCRMGGKGKVIAVDQFMASSERQKIGHKETAEIVLEGSTFGVFRGNIDMFQLADIVTPLSGASREVCASYDGRARLL